MDVYAARRVPSSSRVGRPKKKFTQERIQQIINLVERGKSRAEIAEMMGVSVGSLSVMCSRLGISLRKSRVSNGIRPLRPIFTERMGEPEPGSWGSESIPSSPSRPDAEKSLGGNGALAELRIQLTYKGKERTYRLPLTSDLLKPVACTAARF